MNIQFPSQSDFQTRTLLLEAILTKYIHDTASPLILLQFAYEDMNKLFKSKPITPEELSEFLIQIEWISKSIAAMRKELHYLTENTVIESEQSYSLTAIFADLNKNLPYDRSEVILTVPEIPNVLIHPDTFLLALQSLIAFFQKKSPNSRISSLSITVTYNEEEKFGKIIIHDPDLYLEPALLQQYEAPFKNAHESLHNVYHLIVTNRFLNRDSMWLVMKSEKSTGTYAEIELNHRNFG